MNKNVFRWPPLCKKTSFTITVKAHNDNFGVSIYVLKVKVSNGAIYVAQWPWLFKVIVTFSSSHFRSYLSYSLAKHCQWRTLIVQFVLTKDLGHSWLWSLQSHCPFCLFSYLPIGAHVLVFLVSATSSLCCHGVCRSYEMLTLHFECALRPNMEKISLSTWEGRRVIKMLRSWIHAKCLC